MSGRWRERNTQLTLEVPKGKEKIKKIPAAAGSFTCILDGAPPD